MTSLGQAETRLTSNVREQGLVRGRFFRQGIYYASLCFRPAITYPMYGTS